MFSYYDPIADIAWFPTGKSDYVVSERVRDGLRDYDRTTHKLVAIEIWNASTRLPAKILDGAANARRREGPPRPAADRKKS